MSPLDRAFDILTAALLGFCLAVAVIVPGIDARVTAAVASHAAEPLDVNDRIIVRWEYPDGTEALPPEVMPLWRYVWLPQQRLSDRLSSYDLVVGTILNDPEMQGHLERHGLTPDEQAILRSTLGVE